MTRRRVLCLAVGSAAAAATLSTVALADVAYLATHYSTLYRFTPESGLGIETFEMGIPVRGLCFDGETVFGVASFHGADEAEFVIVENPVSGTPSLTVVAELGRVYGGITKVADLFFGFSRAGADLYSIDVSDPANPIETYIGTNSVGGNGAIAHDPASDTLYAISKHTDALYTVDRLSGESTYVGDLGIDDLSGGAEWFDGQLFMAVQNGSSFDFEIGTVDVVTGAYGLTFTLGEGIADQVATGLAIVPEPACVTLLLVGSLLAWRRMR
jgi:hypothetical protein